MTALAGAPSSSMLPSCFGGAHAKSKEVPPAFLVAGLSGAPAEEMRPVARYILANAVLLTPGVGKQGQHSIPLFGLLFILLWNSTGTP